MTRSNPKPGPEGKVALLLCEALLHALVEERVISRQAALGVIEGVLEVAQESAEVRTVASGEGSATSLIEKIAATFAAKE